MGTQLANKILESIVLDPGSGCWLWEGTIGARGYGQIGINGRMVGAHRISYQEFKGNIPAGIFVCHTCDVRECVRPDHLFLGTCADNNRDAVKKGRNIRGVRVPTAKLSPSDVIVIRADRRTTRKIANDYGVGKTTIAEVKAGRSWKSVPHE